MDAFSAAGGAFLDTFDIYSIGSGSPLIVASRRFWPNDPKGATMSTTNPSDQIALLAMDVQPSTVERYAQSSDLLARLAKTIAAARAATIPVIYVRVKFCQGVVY